MNKALRGRGLATMCALVLGLSAAAPVSGQEADKSSPTPLKGSYMTVTSLADWSFGVSYLHQERELSGGAELAKMTADHVMASVGYSPLDWLQFVGSMGEVKPDMDGEEGEYGLAWGVGTRASLLEFSLGQSPVPGHTRSAHVQADVFLRGASSHFDAQDFEWTELFISPTIVYQETYRAATDWYPYHPLGSAIRAGLVYSGIQADLDDQDLDENRNFGVLLGADLHLNSDVVLSGTAYGMSSKDMSFEVGLNYYF